MLLTEWTELQVVLRVKEARLLLGVLMVEAKELLAVRVKFTP